MRIGHFVGREGDQGECEVFGMRMISIVNAVRSFGLRGAVSIVLPRELKSAYLFKSAVRGKHGLEIGGPSSHFNDGNILPLYKEIASLDNCVFSRTTVWEGTREDHTAFKFYPGKPGKHLVLDATNLSAVPRHSYDFLIASHCLEHIANPIKALKQWSSVTRPNGALIIFLPEHQKTFDRRRSPTPISHMLDDFVNDIGEDDLTHLPEILNKHDMWKDPSAGNRESFASRARDNLSSRCLHHHVFDQHNSRELLEAAGLVVEVVELSLPFHIAILAKTKSDPHVLADGGSGVVVGS